ncbi:MAG: alpha/beta hydrolase [Bacilli bacterium]|nr:alpha/beta hydrolase [Bacilli bacterium]
MLIALIVIGSVLLLFTILFFLALYLLYRFSFYSPKKGQLDDYTDLDGPIFGPYKERLIPMIDAFKKRPFEDLYIESFDKLKLHARYFEVKGSKKVALMFHGYRGTTYRDFCAASKIFMDLGYSIITVDHRAHGLSQGHSITFGVRESKDLVSWVDYAKNRFGEDYEYILVGISMGGATVLLAADKVENMKLLVDCPYSSPRIILQETLKAIKLSPKFFYPLVNLSSIIYGHTNLNKVSAYDSVKNTKNKILIVHGDSDQVVPHHISQKLYETYPDKIQYELFKGANHGSSYLTDADRYIKVVADFLK